MNACAPQDDGRAIYICIQPPSIIATQRLDAGGSQCLLPEAEADEGRGRTVRAKCSEGEVALTSDSTLRDRTVLPPVQKSSEGKDCHASRIQRGRCLHQRRVDCGQGQCLRAVPDAPDASLLLGRPLRGGPRGTSRWTGLRHVHVRHPHNGLDWVQFNMSAVLSISQCKLGCPRSAR